MNSISPRFVAARTGRPILTSVRFQTDPWPHILCGGFLQEEFVLRVQARMLTTRHRFKIDRGDPTRIRYKLIDDLDLARTILSSEFLRFVQACAECSVRINETNSLQLRMMDRRSPYFPVHCDNLAGTRSLVSILYLSPGWTPRSGGRLLLHKSDRVPPSAAIEPLPNRLLLFFGDWGHWHSVERVSGEWRRFTLMSEWLVDDSPKLVCRNMLSEA